MKRRGLFALFLLWNYVMAASLISITPTESRWFVGLALAFLVAALGRWMVMVGREKPPAARVILGQSLATGFASMALVYLASLLWPLAPDPDDASFLAGMVAGGAAVGWLGAEYVVTLLERWRKGKGGNSGG